MILLVGFRGTEIDSTHHIWRDIRDYHVGSVILFDYDAPTGTRGRNIKSPTQVKQLCAQLHALSPTLLIGIDQEGGYIATDLIHFIHFLKRKDYEKINDDRCHDGSCNECKRTERGWSDYSAAKGWY